MSRLDSDTSFLAILHHARELVDQGAKRTPFKWTETERSALWAFYQLGPDGNRETFDAQLAEMEQNPSQHAAFVEFIDQNDDLTQILGAVGEDDEENEDEEQVA